MGTETPIKDDLLERAIVALSMNDGYLAAQVDTRLKALLVAAEASKRLANHVFKSVNVGPLTKNPSREAALWRDLRVALAAVYP